MMKHKSLPFLLVLLALSIGAIPFRAQLRRPFVTLIQIVKDRKTVADRVAQYGDTARARLMPWFSNVGLAYPPERVTLVGLKEERLLQVWVTASDKPWVHLRDYPILGISGVLGPKLKEGDLQVPEGLYKVESLNPNSLYHLSIRVNYPNGQDKHWGRQDGRSDLGSDIMIHGKACSVGCLAMGDAAIEDLFILVAETGIEKVSIILTPFDFRVRDLPDHLPGLPPWSADLYRAIKQALARLSPVATP